MFTERYDYHEAVKDDVLDYLRENYAEAEFREAMQDRDGFEEKLNDDLWICDSVTGNASGSYYCNSWLAEEALCHNLDLLGEALAEFGCGPEYLIENGAEAADVTIRCYVLNGAIYEALDELEATCSPEEANNFDAFCSRFAGCKNCPYHESITLDECKARFAEDNDQ